MGLGRATDLLVQDIVQSREMSENIQKSVAADRRLREVRYGTFADNGVIDQEALSSGTGANLLSAKEAEYESLEIGSIVVTNGNSDGQSPIVNIHGNRRLLLASLPTSNTTHTINGDIISSTGWTRYGPDGASYIFSTHAFQQYAAQTNYVGLQIHAASDDIGTDSELLYENSMSVDALTLINGVFGTLTRLYSFFTTPTGKPYLRLRVRILLNATSPGGVAIGQNMLEIVNDYRSTPSKYVGPTPRKGELGKEQMAFGTNPNLLPYYTATLSGPASASASNDVAEVFINGVEQGRVVPSPLGTGYFFRTKADGSTFFSPNQNLLSNADPRWDTGKVYMLSCDVKNMLGSTDLDIRIRAREGTSHAGLGTNTGTTILGGATTFRVNRGETKRCTILVTPGTDGGSGASYGPKIEVRGTVVAGSASGFFSDFNISNIKLEKVADKQTEASPFSLPVIGDGDLKYNQIEAVPFYYVTKETANQIVGSGSDVQVGMDTFQEGFGFTGTTTPNCNKTGIYIVRGQIMWGVNTTNSLKMEVYLRLLKVGGATLNRTLQTVVIPPPGVGGGTNLVGGIWIGRIEKGDQVALRADNTSSDQRTVQWALIQIGYLGST